MGAIGLGCCASSVDNDEELMAELAKLQFNNQSKVTYENVLNFSFDERSISTGPGSFITKLKADDDSFTKFYLDSEATRVETADCLYEEVLTDWNDDKMETCAGDQQANQEQNLLNTLDQ